MCDIEGRHGISHMAIWMLFLCYRIYLLQQREICSNYLVTNKPLTKEILNEYNATIIDKQIHGCALVAWYEPNINVNSKS